VAVQVIFEGGMRCRQQHAKRALVWAVIALLIAQLGVNLHLDLQHPEAYDPEFGARLAMLQTRRAENPHRPLLLLMGSSRTVQNFLPEVLEPLSLEDGRRPLVFNFSHLGAGPVMNLIELQRLLRAGVHPDWLVVEIMPSQMGDKVQRIQTVTATLADLPIVDDFAPWWQAYGIYARQRLAPWYKHRLFLMHELTAVWLPPTELSPTERVQIGPLGGDFSAHTQGIPGEATRRRNVLCARYSYRPALQSFRFADISVRAMRELMELCKEQRIPVALLLTPESREFRSWYPREVWRQIEEYAADLSRIYDVPLVDARAWLEDTDFLDGHHVHVGGAEKFTRRLGRDVLEPFINGRLRHVQADHLADDLARRVNTEAK
jgi:uncharacterized protein DUF1574